MANPRSGSGLTLAVVLLLAGCASGDEGMAQSWAEVHTSLEAAERAFAQRSLDTGMRTAFLATLDRDAVVFQPGPVPGRDWWESQQDMEGTLWWVPRLVAVARSGELGYTTGPYRFSVSEGTTHGWYVSVWRRGPDGTWRVALDLGTRNPAPRDTGAPPTTHVSWEGVARPAASESVEIVHERLLETDRALSSALTADPRSAYAAVAGVGMRFHGDGAMPLTDHDSIMARLGTLEPATSVARRGGEIAVSGDLAYTYGTADGREGTTGWLRVWRRQAPDGWRLALSVTVPIPHAAGDRGST